MKNNKAWVLGFPETDKTMSEQVGGKGASLAELSRVAGIRVPDGFCITTDAFKEIVGGSRQIDVLLEQLSLLKPGSRTEISALGGAIREAIAALPIPMYMQEEIGRHLSRLGENKPCAVRSSATAEDLPAASFAGQQDTFLNISGRGGHPAACV